MSHSVDIKFWSSCLGDQPMDLELAWLHHWLIFELGRSAWIICSHILDIPITSRRPNHHLHCSASAQISSLFYLSDWFSELHRIAWIFCFHILDIPNTAPSARLNFIPDQLFVLFLWLNLWTWQDCLNIWWLHPWHSNYCSSSTPHLEPQVLQTPIRHAQCITGSGWCC